MMYTRRPSKVKAIQYTGSNIDELYEMLDYKLVTQREGSENKEALYLVYNRGGKARISEGDYVVEGAQELFERYSSERFHKLYQEVE